MYPKITTHSKQNHQIALASKVATIWPNNQVNVTVWINERGSVEVELMDRVSGMRKSIVLLRLGD